MTPRSIVHLVPHTHWDREWYEPFQTFRMRLVDLVDGLLERMVEEPHLAFTLDGQLATVDDYLEVRPEAEPTIRRLVGEGRLAIGPWQILMDEFLVSGETIVRNLELGWYRASELGGVMEVGYLPDMFGHVAQMPQILSRAGIRHAVVWRGVPAAIDGHAFAWAAPDGSTVHAEYLVGGYGNAAYLFEVPDRLSEKIAAYKEASRAAYGERSILAMYGTDHAVPSAELVRLVARENAAQDGTEIRIETLADYIAGFDGGSSSGLSSWAGELRSGARANLLMGVTSARIDLKAACARAERQLERFAEPISALHRDDWPGALLRLAWRKVVESSAHDSICGCSVDSVVAQVLARLGEAEQIATALTGQACAAVGRRVPAGRTAILNPSPMPRSGLVELDLPVPHNWPAAELELPDGTRLLTQETGRTRPLLVEVDMPGRAVPQWIRRRLHGREIFQHQLNGFTLDQFDGLPRLTLEVDREADPPWLDPDEVQAEIAQAVLASPEAAWRVRLRAKPRRTLLSRVPAPPLGWATVVARRAEVHAGSGFAAPVSTARISDAPGPVAATERVLDNGLLTLEVEPDGTLRVLAGGVQIRSACRLVDGGDQGDSYNYAPPDDDRLVDVPDAVDVRTISVGPLVAELTIKRRYRWPVGLTDEGTRRSEEMAAVVVTTRVQLRAGEPFVRLRITFDNVTSDHRLRLHVPLPSPAERSAAEGQFAVVQRGLEAEGGYGEHPLPTFPARGWVDAGGVAVLLDHVTEYELVPGLLARDELALTLLRSIGLLSRNANPWREEPAGPEIAIPAAQLHGPWSVGFALYPHGGDWIEGRVLEVAEAYHHGFLVAPGLGPGDGSAEAAGLAIDGQGVVLSSLRRRGEWLELRLVAEHPGPTIAQLSGAFTAARDADLLGRPGGSIPLESQGTVRLSLGPWEIRTIQLWPVGAAGSTPT